MLAAALAGHAEEKKIPLWQSTRWTQIEAAIGQVNLDGTLRLSFPLVADGSGLKQLGIPFELEHCVEADAFGRARSVWRVKGLQSCLVPADRDKLRWQPLAGGTIRFERQKIGRALTNAGSSLWLIRESATGDYEIRSFDGRAWRYSQGLLVGCEHPAMGALQFTTQGAWITQIHQAEAAAGEAPLLQARYDESGRLISWQTGVEKSQRLTWNEDGQLTQWQRADGSEVQLTYRDNLLSRIQETGKPPQDFRWQENPGYERGDSRWAAPVHLDSDGANTYTYNLTSKGFVLQRTEFGSGAVTTTTFNPRRRRLSQQAGGFNFLVVFRSGAGGTSLGRIELNGEVVEKYGKRPAGDLIGEGGRRW